jgi:hypothetical protein
MTTTGTDVIRSALRARKFNLAARAKDLGMPCNALQDFSLAARLRQRKCARSRWTYGRAGNVIYDPVADRLRPAMKHSPKPPGAYPPPAFTPTPLDDGGGPHPVKPQPPAARAPRPGWA